MFELNMTDWQCSCHSSARALNSAAGSAGGMSVPRVVAGGGGPKFVEFFVAGGGGVVRDVRGEHARLAGLLPLVGEGLELRRRVCGGHVRTSRGGRRWGGRGGPVAPRRQPGQGTGQGRRE